MVIKPEDHEKIKRMYVNGLLPVIKIAERFNVSRVSIYKVLQKAGVDTGKNGPIEFVCLHCGKKYSLHRCKIRKLRERYKFCSAACFKKK